MYITAFIFTGNTAASLLEGTDLSLQMSQNFVDIPSLIKQKGEIK